jgi:4-hydroxybenzoate polyprenyltransferase
MVTARTAAMTFNRLADRGFDAVNPRTLGRELVQGRVGTAEAWVLFTLAAAAFIASAGRLNRVCLLLSPVALAIVCGYSYTKRFTSLSHLVLGLSLAIAPVGVWLALAAPFELTPLALAAGVLAWVAGFDILYACQDLAFDQRMGLHSIPVRWGLRSALRLSSLAHAVCLAALAAVGAFAGLDGWYFAGVVLIGTILVYEHWIVRPDDLSRLDLAFFNLNGAVGLLYLVFTWIDLW